MKIGHEFHAMHGFTGSAMGKDMSPKIHGYKRGGMEMGEHHNHDDHPKNHDHGHDDKHGFHVHKGHKK